MHPVGFRNWLFRQSSEWYSGGVPGLELSSRREDGLIRYDFHMGGKNVAYATVRPDHEQDGKELLEGLYVSPKHRRKGLARKLVQHIKQEHPGPLRVRPRPFKDMAADIGSLKKFYASEGFKPVGDKRDNMILDKLSSGFAALMKLAALDETEKNLFREVIRKQQAFDQAASGGKMDDAQREAHRANTERLQHFTSKRKDSKYKIPDWAKNPDAPKPGGTTSRGARGRPPPPGQSYKYRGVDPFKVNIPYRQMALSGAFHGATLGTIMDMRPGKKKRIQKGKERGPIAEFAAKSPALYGAGYGAAAIPAALYGAVNARPSLSGAAGLAGLLAPAGATFLADKAINFARGGTPHELEERKRKRREAYARKAKTPKMPKPSTGPKVQKPQPAAAPA